MRKSRCLPASLHATLTPAPWAWLTRSGVAGRKLITWFQEDARAASFMVPPPLPVAHDEFPAAVACPTVLLWRRWPAILALGVIAGAKGAVAAEASRDVGTSDWPAL